MSRMGDSMRNMASSWMLKSREPEFQDMADYTKTFREKMVAMETISDKIAKDRFGKFGMPMPVTWPMPTVTLSFFLRFT